MHGDTFLRRCLQLGLGAFLATAWLAAPAGAQEPKFDGVTLRVATWGGSWRDNIHKLIGAEVEKRGGKVEYVVGNPRDNLTKLINARGQPAPFDVMEVDDATKPFVKEGKFLAPLDYARIPNSAGLAPSQRGDDMVGTWLTQHGIVYNETKFKELGIPKPQRLTDLLNPRLKGRVSFPDINVGFVVNGIAGFAIEGGGDEGNIDPGLALIRKLEVASYYKSSVDLSTQFKSEDVWAAVWQAGWALRLRAAGVPVAISFPQIGDRRGMAQLGWIGVVKGAREKAAAEFFIDRYLSPSVQEELARQTGVASIQRAAVEKLLADPMLREFMILEPKAVEQIFYVDWTKIDMNRWVDQWNRTMAR